MREKVLIIQSAFIGDAILASSMLETVHRENPEAEIHLLVRKGNEALYASHPFLAKLWVWDKSHKYKSLFNLLSAIRKERFHYVFCAQRFGTMGLFTVLCGAKIKVGFKKNPWSFLFTKRIAHHFAPNWHEIDRNNGLLEPWLGKIKPALPRLYPSEKDRATSAQYKGKPYLCLFPSSVWATKQLPAEKWLELIELNPSYRIYLMGSPADKALCDSILKASKHPDIQNLCGKLKLLESAALMEGAKMNFVNDSAPLHLATATNSPVRAFYCSTIPEFGFGPLSEDSAVIETKEKLSCRPCGLHGKKACPLGHFRCAFTIDLKNLAL
ncbi:MAG: glycosyltransferase family 9 protein [Luteibaculum sp.]